MPDQTDLRDRIATAIWAQYPDAEPSRTGLVLANPHAVADVVLAVLPQPADQAAVEAERDSLGREADRLRKDWVEMRARAEGAEAERDAYGEQLDEAAETIAARTIEINRLADELRRMAAETQQPETEEEGELVCVDECGNCDACGMEPFGTPAEGWREAARFLRRTPRDSADFPGAIRGARLIEDELRRRAEDAQQNETADSDETEAPPVCEGFVWIGQSFAICDRCGQPAWEHVGEEVPIEGAGLFDNRRTVRPWEPGQADRIRAKWGTPAGGEASRG